MRLRRYTAAILLVLMLVLLAGCSEGIVVPTPTPQGGQAAAQRTVFAMDTVMDLKPEGEHAGEALDLAEARIGTVVNVHSYLNVRTGAGTSNQIIGHLLPGAQVKVLGESGGWYRVTVPEITGYVCGDYLFGNERFDV